MEHKNVLQNSRNLFKATLFSNFGCNHFWLSANQPGLPSISQLPKSLGDLPSICPFNVGPEGIRGWIDDPASVRLRARRVIRSDAFVLGNTANASL
ncbi:hypothetical protein CEXT_481691 [Caerostris extrusa]|uniref:Uncharacterized protein n=1 Tax=Caerostris extrusa TaxID=172846 RepID=A0AAV4QYJ2_CAEEX|nr:hypothetical protein CEXT_481691 [Caerostris extrusa]